MAEGIPNLSLLKVTLALEAAIEKGAWAEEEGICGHCYSIGEVFQANVELAYQYSPNMPLISTCRECLIHRSLWNTYLEVYP